MDVFCIFYRTKRLPHFPVSLMELGSDTLSEGRGALELPCVQRSCKTDTTDFLCSPFKRGLRGLYSHLKCFCDLEPLKTTIDFSHDQTTYLDRRSARSASSIETDDCQFEQICLSVRLPVCWLSIFIAVLSAFIG